jgi:hypothetical protein
MPTIPGGIPGYRFTPTDTSQQMDILTPVSAADTATEKAGFSFSSIMGLAQQVKIEDGMDAHGRPEVHGRPKRRLSIRTSDMPGSSSPTLESGRAAGRKKRKPSPDFVPEAPPSATSSQHPEKRRKSGRSKRTIVPQDMLQGMLEHPDFAALEEETKEPTKPAKSSGSKKAAAKAAATVSATEDITVRRLERRRERNRTAARRSRERRVKYMEDLESEWVDRGRVTLLIAKSDIFWPLPTQNHSAPRRQRENAQPAARVRR